MQPISLNSQLHTVRGRLFLLIAALLVPALGIIAALSWESYRTQRAAVRAELANTARAVAGLVDTEVDRSLAILRTISAARSVRDRDWATLDDTARRVLADAARWLVVVDMEGRQIINTRTPRGTPLPDLKLAPEHVAAMRAGQPYVSHIAFDPVAQDLVVHVSLPITQSDGSVLGISLAMEADVLRETFDVGRFAPDGALAVLDHDAHIVVRSPYRKEFIGGLATPDMVKLVQQKVDTVVDSVTLENIPVLTAYSRARCGWNVIIGSPIARLYANAQRIFLIGVGSALLVTLAAIGLAAWIGREVVRGVDELARDAERLARGEAAGELNSRLAEITMIAGAMRSMAATRADAEVQLREARDRLHYYAQELEKKVQERTASLRDAVAQMEEFSYTVSHDLRGPLRAMSAFATALLEDYGPSLDAQAQDYLRRIVRASERMSRLTSDLLTYSRVARDDMQLERVRLEPMLRGAIEQHAELSPKEADIRLAVPLHDVLAHETSLTQALTNLLINAAKFVKPGERPQITVRTERHEDRVRVWVEDKGIGIPPAHQERLFRIFERTPGANGYSGTGVGLAIVRKIVDKMRGTCGVESSGDSGSRFWIELRAPE